MIDRLRLSALQLVASFPAEQGLVHVPGDALCSGHALCSGNVTGD